MGKSSLINLLTGQDHLAKVRGMSFALRLSPKRLQCRPTGGMEYERLGILRHPLTEQVSKTPGKTRTINHFLINETWYLVDLPGYGYARASEVGGAFCALK